MPIHKNNGEADFDGPQLPSMNNVAFGRLLKFWRSVYRFSQESLALSIDASPRHISFLENSKAAPSKDMVEKIAGSFGLSVSNKNNLLIAAGYIPVPHNLDFFSDEFKWLRKAAMLMLRSAEPYPCIVMNNAGKLLMVNKAWVAFYSQSINKQVLYNVDNHFDFLFSQNGAGNVVSGWDDTLAVILMALQQSALIRNDEESLRLLDRFSSHPTVPKDWQVRATKLEPMASFRLMVKINGESHPFFSVSQTVGALGPLSYGAQPDLITYTLYPENDDLDLSYLLEQEVDHPLLYR